MKKNKLLLISLLLILSLGTLFSCNNNVTITFINEDVNKGTIADGKTDKITVARGNLVQIKATPKDGYLLTGWYKVLSDTEEVGDCFDTTYTFTATENLTIKAKWENYSSKAFNFELIKEGDYKDTYMVKRYHGDENKIIVPATHHGRKVTAIARETFIGITCNEIIVSEGINTLYTEAFKGCALTGKNACVKLPNSLVHTNGYTFSGWTTSQTIAIHEASIVTRQSSKETKWGWILNESQHTISSSTCSEQLVTYTIY